MKKILYIEILCAGLLLTSCRSDNYDENLAPAYGIWNSYSPMYDGMTDEDVLSSVETTMITPDYIVFDEISLDSYDDLDKRYNKDITESENFILYDAKKVEDGVDFYIKGESYPSVLFRYSDDGSGYLILGESSFESVKVTNIKNINAENALKSEQTSDGAHSKKVTSIEGEWQRLFKASESGYLCFNTSWGFGGHPYYLVLHPFVFSDDCLRGKAYFTYGDCPYWGDYEIVGEYLRIYCIADYSQQRLGICKDRIYKVSKDGDGGLYLTGRFVKNNDITTMTLRSDIPSRIKRDLDSDEYRMHDL